MLGVVLGVTIGAIVGWIENVFLFRAMDRAIRDGKEPLAAVGGIFFGRYLVDAAVLVMFWLITRDAYGVTAAALSITVAIKISLFMVLRRKGGKID